MIDACEYVIERTAKAYEKKTGNALAVSYTYFCLIEDPAVEHLRPQWPGDPLPDWCPYPQRYCDAKASRDLLKDLQHNGAEAKYETVYPEEI